MGRLFHGSHLIHGFGETQLTVYDTWQKSSEQQSIIQILSRILSKRKMHRMKILFLRLS